MSPSSTLASSKLSSRKATSQLSSRSVDIILKAVDTWYESVRKGKSLLESICSVGANNVDECSDADDAGGEAVNAYASLDSTATCRYNYDVEALVVELASCVGAMRSAHRQIRTSKSALASRLSTARMSAQISTLDCGSKTTSPASTGEGILHGVQCAEAVALSAAAVLDDQLGRQLAYNEQVMQEIGPAVVHSTTNGGERQGIFLTAVWTHQPAVDDDKQDVAIHRLSP